MTTEPVPEPEFEALTPPAPSPRALALAMLSPQRAAFELAWPGIVEQLFRASGGTVTFAIVGQLGAVATAGWGLTGVWVAVFVDYFVRAGLMARRSHGGAWARRRI